MENRSNRKYATFFTFDAQSKCSKAKQISLMLQNYRVVMLNQRRVWQNKLEAKILLYLVETDVSSRFIIYFFS